VTNYTVSRLCCTYNVWDINATFLHLLLFTPSGYLFLYLELALRSSTQMIQGVMPSCENTRNKYLHILNNWINLTTLNNYVNKENFIQSKRLPYLTSLHDRQVILYIVGTWKVMRWVSLHTLSH
jgi:WD40 repeat protein